MRCTYTILFSLLVWLNMNIIALATADGPDRYCVKGVAKDDSLNIREKPKAKAKIIAKVSNGTCGIQNVGMCVGKNGEAISDSDAPTHNKTLPFWCKVKFKGITGWTALRFLTEDTNP